MTDSQTAAALETFKNYHRIFTDAATLRTMAATLYPLASQQVVITETTFEGSNTTIGVIGVPAAVVLQAVLDVLLEKDPTAVDAQNAPDLVNQTSFGYRPVLV